jgi:hypothetical protein
VRDIFSLKLAKRRILVLAKEKNSQLHLALPRKHFSQKSSQKVPLAFLDSIKSGQLFLLGIRLTAQT